MQSTPKSTVFININLILLVLCIYTYIKGGREESLIYYYKRRNMSNVQLYFRWCGNSKYNTAQGAHRVNDKTGRGHIDFFYLYRTEKVP